jgi:hypothetical protein
MNKRLYWLIRDAHLYLGLFISPFVLAFAISVFYLVHAWIPGAKSEAVKTRVVSDLTLPANLTELSGRPLVDALRPILDRAGVAGEVDFVQHRRKENRLIIPVTVPGRLTTMKLDLAKREASIETRDTGLADALIVLHKSPGPHLATIRMNWFYMRVWSWLADATVYLVLFLSVSGIYLWYVLRAARFTGTLLLVGGAVTFFGIVYALCH